MKVLGFSQENNGDIYATILIKLVKLHSTVNNIRFLEVNMDSGKSVFRFLPMLIIGFVQLIMTQIVTLLFSFLISDAETYPQTHPAQFVAFLGLTYTLGVFGVGWLALKLRWIHSAPKYPVRLAATLVGAYLPLIVALIVFHPLQAGNPFFLIAILTSILGFYLPGWVGKGQPASSGTAIH
jgi:hypothetical protein